MTIVSLIAAVCCTALVGCGGSGGGGAAEQTLQFGSLTTRIAGTVQPPVTSTGAGAAVTGVAGGNISSLTLEDTSLTLAETKIAFSSNRDGNQEIYAMEPDGKGLARLTTNGSIDYLPEWSPDGTKIAFTSSRDGNYEIYVMNADGTDQTNLTNDAAADLDSSWSPDGTKIAFRSNRNGNYEIYVMNADGTEQTNLTNNAAADISPDWSSDGSKIAFISLRDGNYEVYVMNADGTGQTRLTYDAASDYDPAWSPDGLRIAFASYRDINYEVYVMNADGSSPKRITNNVATDYLPTWSPDGAKIAFTSFRPGNGEIYSMNADGTSETRLTNYFATNDYASWGPFTRTRTLVGAGGSMGTNAAGFLFGQAYSRILSLLVFDVVTRNSARVKAQTGMNENGPNLLFSLSADSIKSLAYINFTDRFEKVTIVIDGPGTATDTLVSFDSSNGRVASVLPYTSNRSPAPAFSLENGTRIIRGRFLGAWDGKGVNRAPNGASEVRLDSRTGEILAVK